MPGVTQAREVDFGRLICAGRTREEDDGATQKDPAWKGQLDPFLVSCCQKQHDHDDVAYEDCLMTDVGVEELGPVDWIVVEFEGSEFNGEIAPAPQDLVDRELIRVLDLLVLKNDADGSLEAFELSDLDETELGELRAYEAELALLLSEEDVAAVAAAVEPGSSAAVLAWENSWAAPFAMAVRRSGGQLVASGRIPVQALLAAIEDDIDDEDQSTERSAEVGA